MWVKVRGLFEPDLGLNLNWLSFLGKLWNFFTISGEVRGGRVHSRSNPMIFLFSLSFFLGCLDLGWAKKPDNERICELAFIAGGFAELTTAPQSGSEWVPDRSLPIVRQDGSVNMVGGQARFLDIPDAEIEWIREWANRNGAANVASMLDAAREYMIQMANSYRLKKDPSKIFVPTVSVPVGISKQYIENFLLRAEASVNARAFIEGKILTGQKLLNEYEKHLKDNSKPSQKLLEDLTEHFEVNHVDLTVRETVFRMAATEPSRIRQGFDGEKLKGYPVSAVRGLDGLHKSDKPGVVSSNELGKITNVTEFNNLTPSGKSNLIQILEAIRLLEVQRGIPEHDSLAAHILKNHITPNELAGTDNVFREVMLANARKWTQSSDGELVLIGPGPLNSAHPDISAISQVDGVPAVQWGDLYFHKGAIYLNDGTRNFAGHKKVTGVYSRQDPRTPLADPRIGIGMYWPDASELKDNVKRAKQINARYPTRKPVELLNGTPYLFVKDRRGRVVDVMRDSNGKAMMLSSASRLGRNPRNPTQEPPPIAQMVEDRKLWISNIGGDLADTKDWQALVDKVYAEKFRPDQLPQNQKHLSTPAPLTQEQLRQYFTGELQGEFVLKEVRGSSGTGVHFKISSPTKDFEKKFEEARQEFNSPQGLRNFTVEPFDIPFLVTQALTRGGEGKFVDVTNDIRLFVLRRHDGKLFVWGFLGRTALPGSTWSNTGKGGGYVYAFIYDPKNPRAKPVNLNESLLNPKTSETMPLPKSGREAVSGFLQQLNQVEAILRYSMLGNPNERNLRESQARDRLLSQATFNPFSGYDDYKDASNLSIVNAFRHEALPYLDIRLEVGVHRLWSLFKLFEQQQKDYQAKKTGATEPKFAEFRTEVLEIIENLRRLALQQKSAPSGAPAVFAYSEIADLILRYLAKPVNVRSLAKDPAPIDGVTIRQSRLAAEKLTYESFPEPLRLIERRLPTKVGDKFVEVVAVGEIKESTDSQMQKYLGIVQGGGGRVFIVRYRDIKTGELLPDIVSADHYFVDNDAGVQSQVLKNGDRFVEVDIGDPNVLAGLAHEAQHVDFFGQVMAYLQNPTLARSESRLAIEKLIRSSNALTAAVDSGWPAAKRDEEARLKLAKTIVLSSEGRELDETRSLKWEMIAEAYGATLPKERRSAFNDPDMIHRARTPKSFGYVNRMSYPHMVRISDLARKTVVKQIKALKLRRSDEWTPTDATVEDFTVEARSAIESSLKLAAETRNKNLKDLYEEYSKLAKLLAAKSPNERGYAAIAQKMNLVKSAIDTWASGTLWHSIVSGYDLTRMTSERSHVLISKAFQKVYKDLKDQEPFAFMVSDKRVIRILTPNEELAAMLEAQQAVADPQAHLTPSQQQ